MIIEAELVARAHAGDIGALDDLLARSRRDLQKFARRACGNASDADDALQVALYQIERRLHSLRALAAFTGWVMRIIDRECRRIFRVAASMVSDERETAVIDDPTLRRDLARALASLPPTYREVLLLRDVEEWSAPEVAVHLDISVMAVKSRLHRARSLMREALE